MASKITLNPVNYYDDMDIYTTSVDNRPLYNISSNIDLLNNTIALSGFYQEINANPETEPVGGFLPLTCAYVGANGLLYPIDITQQITVIDYTTYPIYLVTASLGNSQYQSVSFSATITISNLYNNFLANATGHALKVGPGGALVDEVYFDLYYSAYNYQNLFVGKILTPNTISFGGNQVNVLTDNRFIAKNINDSTTGLLTHYVDNSATSIADFNILINTINSAYPFVTYINQIGTNSVNGITSSSPLPIYFSSTLLTANQDGSFSGNNIESLLDEIHFASPAVSASLTSDDKLGTAGVNTRTLYGFAQNYLLHSQNLSTNLSELSQNISTSLYFNSASASSTIGIFAQFDTVNISYGNTTTSILGSTLAPYLTSMAVTSSHGICFGGFKQTGLGAFIGYLSNTDTALNYLDAVSSNVVSSLVGSSALTFSNKNATYNAIMSFDTDITIFNNSVGAYYLNTPTQALELVNKQYVDASVSSAVAIADSMVPLAGNSSTNPITGSLYTDITSSSDTNTVLLFNTLTQTNIASSNPIVFSILGSSGQSGYQVIRAGAPIDTSSTSVDVVNVGYLQTYVAGLSVVGPALLGSSTTSQLFLGLNEFSQTTTFDTDTPINLSATDQTVNIDCQGGSVVLKGNTAAFRVMINSGATLATTDPANCLVDKGYLDNNLATLVDTVLGPSITATWNYNSVNAFTTPINKVVGGVPTWYMAVSQTPDYDNNFLTSGSYPCFTPKSDGSFLFNGLNPSTNTGSAVFHFDLNIMNPGNFQTFIVQTAIVKVNSNGISTVLSTIDESGTAKDSWIRLGHACSITAVLDPLDSIYFLFSTLSSAGAYSSASISRIR